MDNMFNANNGGNFIPIIDSDYSDTKLNEDQYEVYVNGNLVGHKTLKTQGEDLSDIDGFLHNQGLTNFTTSLEGDHYMIKAEEAEEDVTNALSVYFNNR